MIGELIDPVVGSIGGVLKRVFGSANDRILAGLNKHIDAINTLEPELETLSDEDLRARTDWMRRRFKDGESLEDLLVDAFATVREAAKRTLGPVSYTHLTLPTKRIV